MTDPEMIESLKQVWTEVGDRFCDAVLLASEDQKDKLKQELQDPDFVKAFIDYASSDFDKITNTVSRPLDTI